MLSLHLEISVDIWREIVIAAVPARFSEDNWKAFEEGRGRR